jgi:hypothetical protein
MQFQLIEMNIQMGMMGEKGCSNFMEIDLMPFQCALRPIFATIFVMNQSNPGYSVQPARTTDAADNRSFALVGNVRNHPVREKFEKSSEITITPCSHLL